MVVNGLKNIYQKLARRATDAALALSNDTEKVVRLAFDANKFDENEVKANYYKRLPFTFL